MREREGEREIAVREWENGERMRETWGKNELSTMILDYIYKTYHNWFFSHGNFKISHRKLNKRVNKFSRKLKIAAQFSKHPKTDLSFAPNFHTFFSLPQLKWGNF